MSRTHVIFTSGTQHTIPENEVTQGVRLLQSSSNDSPFISTRWLIRCIAGTGQLIPGGGGGLVDGGRGVGGWGGGGGGV